MKFTPVGPKHKWLTLDPAESLPYNNWDHNNTARLYTSQLTRLERSGNLEWYNNWFRNFIPAILRMQTRGFGQVDKTARKRFAKQLEAEIHEVESDFLEGVTLFEEAAAADACLLESMREEAERKYETAAAEVRAWAEASTRRAPHARMRKVAQSHAAAARARERKAATLAKQLAKRRASFFNSRKDLPHVLFDLWDLRPAPPRKVGKKRAPRSVSQEALLFILDRFRVKDEPLREKLHDLLHRSRLNTILTRYVKPLDKFIAPNGRLYPTIRCAAAETIRLAFSDPALQQWPSEIRHLLTARKGHVLIGRDYSAIEARIMAYEFNDTPSIRIFESGGDIHAFNMSIMFGIPYNSIDKTKPDHAKKRGYCKKDLYRRIYGGTLDAGQDIFCPCHRCVEKMPDLLNVSRAERERMDELWHKAHPNFRRSQNALLNRVRNNGRRWTSRFGLTRRFHEPWPGCKNQIANAPMQNGAAEIINRAIVELDRIGAPLVLQHHDELVLECPEADAPEWDAILKETMERPIPEYNNAVFPTEGHIGYTWGDLK